MKKAAKKWGLFGLRWGIAILGIWWVVSKISLDDEAVVMDASQQLVAVQVVREVPETGAVLVREEANGTSADELWGRERDVMELLSRMEGGSRARQDNPLTSDHSTQRR